MTQTNFRSLQDQHDLLLRKQQDLSEESEPEFIKGVKEYIEETKRGGSYVAASRERDQLRANLRYWANYIYSIEKTFPDTELAPSTVQDRSSLTTISGLIGIAIALLLLAGFFLNGLLNRNPPATEPPVETETATIAATATLPDVPATEPPVSTAVSEEPDVVMTSPQNGQNVPPRITFQGAYTNLSAQSTIHVLLIRNDRLYPLQESFQPGSTAGEWEINGTLYRNPDDLAQAETLVVVPGACLDDRCRETLAGDAATSAGLAIEELPSQFSFKLFQSSSRAVYRNAFEALLELRLVYPRVIEGSPGQSSYDLYSSKPDGTEERAITSLPGIDERFPSLSPNGRQIVYVQVVRVTNAHSIHIMDSNGENDREIINGGKNILENPQWSPDGDYIAYTLGDTSISSNTTYWSIHTFHLNNGQDEIISGKPAPHILNRYYSWMPDQTTREILLNADTSLTLDSGILKVPIDSPEGAVLFYDDEPDEVQPNVTEVGDGYLLTFTIIDKQTFEHEIYAILDPDRELPLKGTRVKLITISSRSGGRDHPMVEPDSNMIYYVNAGNIYKVTFRIEENKIIMLPGTIEDGEYFGDVVIRTGTISDNPSFDIQYMEAYYPIPSQ